MERITQGRQRTRRGLAVIVPVTLAMVATSVTGGAAADHVRCGDVITASITLTHDVGPCQDSDGLIIRADDVTVDLGGHRILAASPNGALENVGIRLAGVTGVTVQNGTVEGFDAGVFIAFGGHNTVQRISAVENINDMAEPWRFEPGRAASEQPDVVEGNVSSRRWAAEMLCVFGDGITTEASDGNVIRHNTVADNGPYGGITLVGDSDGNRVERNAVHANNVSNWTTWADGEQGTGLCGATLGGETGMQRGRQVQSMGIRLEGPGANDNVVVGNRVTDSALVGISIHSWVCSPPGEARPGASNERNLIADNRVSGTGLERSYAAGRFAFSLDGETFADGISSLAQGPVGRHTCTSHDNAIVGNTSIGNDRHGVSLHRAVEATEVSRNVANGNGGSGILVAEGAMNNTLQRNRAADNGELDGFDGNAACDNNDWSANRFVTVNRGCVAAGGTGFVNGPGRAGSADLAGMEPSRSR